MKTKHHSQNEQSPAHPPDPHQKRSVLWLVLILFISGWMFFLGVIVGRGTAPAMFDYQKIETEIAALTQTFTESRKTKNDMDSDILSTQAELEYPEELKKKTEDPARMLMPTPTLTPTSIPTSIPAKPAVETPKTLHQESPAMPLFPPKPDLRATVKPESIETAPDAIRTAPEVKIKSMYDLKAIQARESVHEKTVPTVPERTPAAVAKPQPPASDNKLAASMPVTVQMPSLMDKKSADALIESLRSKGISASKTPKMVQGKGIWYTVVIGKYTSATEADAVMNRLKQENMDAVKH
jgi:septal ring-binding cell division protein DamX